MTFSVPCVVFALVALLHTIPGTASGAGVDLTSGAGGSSAGSSTGGGSGKGILPSQLCKEALVRRNVLACLLCTGFSSTCLSPGGGNGSSSSGSGSSGGPGNSGGSGGSGSSGGSGGTPPPENPASGDEAKAI